MSDIERFGVFMLAACVVFLGALRLAIRKRIVRPSLLLLTGITVVVVVGGMLFARYGHILLRPPWWIYYGVPALVTFLLPPVVLRTSLAEVGRYVPMAILMAPAIHVAFSLLVGWHDYMPFPVYIPSLLELIRPT
jgi:hypothetical protein